jgi:hypothetical protein
MVKPWVEVPPWPGGAAIKAAAQSSGEVAVTEEDIKGELERLRQENERLKRERSRGISLRVSEKGAVSVYGLGRFPVTLYKEQWVKLLAVADDILAFIKENDARLKAKS